MSEPERPIITPSRTRVRKRGHRYQPYPRRSVMQTQTDAVPHGTQPTS